MPARPARLALFALPSALLCGCWAAEADLSTSVGGPFATSGFRVELTIEIPEDTELNPNMEPTIEPPSATLEGLIGHGSWRRMSWYDTVVATEPGLHTYTLPLNRFGDEASIELEFADPVGLALDLTGIAPGDPLVTEGSVHYLAPSGGLVNTWTVVDAAARPLAGEADLEVLESPASQESTELYAWGRQLVSATPDGSGTLRVRTPAGEELGGPTLVARSVDELTEEGWTLDVRVEEGLYVVDLRDPDGTAVLARPAREALHERDQGFLRLDGEALAGRDCGLRLSTPNHPALHEVEYCVEGLCGTFELPGLVEDQDDDECFFDDGPSGCVEVAGSGAPRVPWLLVLAPVVLLTARRRA